MTTTYEQVLVEVDKRVNMLVQKGAGRVTEQEATAQVFRDSPELYQRYRQLASAPGAATPTRGPELPDSAHRLAKVLAPDDPEGKGMRLVDRCLEELIATIQRRHAA
jgi:hypothetical protein